MAVLFRVFPYVAGAPEEEPGGAQYVPPQGGGRLDNPGLYGVLYLSDSPAGAIAEALGRFPEWTPAVLAGSPALPGSVRAIARYQLGEEAKLCDLDEPRQLLSMPLRPSEVVSHDYARTRAWARRIFEQGGWAGIRWWSYYDSRWASVGLWETRQLSLEQVQPLRLEDAAMVEASRTIARRIVMA